MPREDPVEQQADVGVVRRHGAVLGCDAARGCALGMEFSKVTALDPTTSRAAGVAAEGERVEGARCTIRPGLYSS